MRLTASKDEKIYSYNLVSKQTSGLLAIFVPNVIMNFYNIILSIINIIIITQLIMQTIVNLHNRTEEER